MFENILISTLRADSILTSYLSTFSLIGSTMPSIFSNSAPEKVDFTYIVTKISDTGNTEDAAIDTFVISINIFGFGSSGKNERLAVKRIIKLLDRQNLSDSYYDNIRFFKIGSDFVEHEDPKAQHYNIRFSARAGRKEWSSDL